MGLLKPFAHFLPISQQVARLNAAHYKCAENPERDCLGDRLGWLIKMGASVDGDMSLLRAQELWESSFSRQQTLSLLGTGTPGKVSQNPASRGREGLSLVGTKASRETAGQSPQTKAFKTRTSRAPGTVSGAPWDTEWAPPGSVLKGGEQYPGWGRGTPSRGEHPDQVWEREARRENKPPCFPQQQGPTARGITRWPGGSQLRSLAWESSPGLSCSIQRPQACHTRPRHHPA